MAKDFLSYVYTDERWLDYAAGAIPASKRVSDRYGADIPPTICSAPMPITYGISRAAAPTPRRCAMSSYTGIHDLLMGKTTPEECAASWTSAATPPSTKAGPKANCTSRSALQSNWQPW